jgi:hypothetical protein
MFLNPACDKRNGGLRYKSFNNCFELFPVHYNGKIIL